MAGDSLTCAEEGWRVTTQPGRGFAHLDLKAHSCMVKVVLTVAALLLREHWSLARAQNKSRNRFSESHFASEAGRWLAVYVRDFANTQIRLLLHFM